MTTSENPWKSFFDQHAPVYEQEVFTHNTDQEIQFLIDEFSLPTGSHILDVGCGTGRHAIELAKLGYRVTGVDISSGMLSQASEAAEKAGVEVDWIQSDAVEMDINQPCDGVICLCEGSFGLIGRTEQVATHDRRILEAIHRVSKPGSKLILNAPNGLAKIRTASVSDVESGAFDPMTLTETFDVEVSTPGGEEKLQVHERGYVPSEFGLLLELCGFEVQAIYGGTAGAWNRQTVSLDEVELMAIATRC